MSSERLRKIISILASGNAWLKKKPEMSTNASKNSKMPSIKQIKILAMPRRWPKMKTSSNSSRTSDPYMMNSTPSIETNVRNLIRIQNLISQKEIECDCDWYPASRKINQGITEETLWNRKKCVWCRPRNRLYFEKWDYHWKWKDRFKYDYKT